MKLRGSFCDWQQNAPALGAESTNGKCIGVGDTHGTYRVRDFAGACRSPRAGLSFDCYVVCFHFHHVISVPWEVGHPLSYPLTFLNLFYGAEERLFLHVPLPALAIYDTASVCRIMCGNEYLSTIGKGYCEYAFFFHLVSLTFYAYNIAQKMPLVNPVS